MVRILDAGTVRDLVDLAELLDVIETAFERQAAGAVERPPRPHYPVGVGLDPEDPDEPTGTGLVMPAYIHGAEYYVTKLVGVHEENPARGLPTVRAQIAVSDAMTGEPVAYMDGSVVTAARTSCIGGLASRYLTSGPVSVGVIGAGTQARWQIRAIATASSLESVTVYDLDRAVAESAAGELGSELDATVEVAADARSAVDGADLVVTATTSPEPVFPGEALAPGAVVVAIGAYTPDMQELDEPTVEGAARVFADVPQEVAEIGDIAATDLQQRDLIPFVEVFDGGTGHVTGTQDPGSGHIVVESVGSAVMDAAAAAELFDAAVRAEVGTLLEL